jgi:hypothetical protein
LTITGNVFLGETLSFAPSGAALQYGGTANSYVQMVMQNKSPLTNASTDFVATADNGNDASYFVDLGIASSSYYYAGYDSILPNDSYIIANGGNLLLNAGSAGKAVRFVVGGSNTGNIVGQITNTAVTFNQTTESTSTTTGALQVAGGAGFGGNLNSGGYISAANGISNTGTYPLALTSGMVMDHAGNVGRFSVSSGNGFAFYGNGLATSTLMSLENTGNLTVAGPINTTGNLSAANLHLSAANAVITTNGQGFTLNGVRAVTYFGNVNFGTNTTSVVANLTLSSQSRIAFDINSNVTVTFGGTITPGVEKFMAFRNKESTTANIILPTANNNKGTTVIPVAGNAVASIWMIAADNTSGNVIMTVVNN